MMINKVVLNVEEAAHELGCNDYRIYKLIDSGALQAFKIGGRRWKITGESIEQYKDSMLTIYSNHENLSGEKKNNTKGTYE